MTEWRLFPEGTIPDYTTPEWYVSRASAAHLEEPEHRGRLHRSARFVAEAAMTGLSTVVDLGSGDGGLLSLLGPAVKGWGYDLCPANVAAAAGRGVDVRYGNVLEDPIEWGDIAVATEMLEHLVDPHAFVRHIHANAQVLVCSSPWNERPGAAYEYHAWAWDFDGYRALINQAGFVIRKHEPVGAFQVIMAVKP